MAPKIDEPTRLAQFASGSKHKSLGVFVSRDTPNLEGVTVAVQDVGIHSIATSSGAKEGPAPFASTSRFFSPAVTVIHSDQVQRTYAAASREGKKSEGGKVLAVWSRPVESTAETPEYSQLKFDSRISRIHACAALPDRTIIIHEDGKISLVSSELKILSVQPALRAGTVLESWFFPTAGSFVSSGLGEAVALVLVRDGEAARLSAVVVTLEDGLSVVGSVELSGIVASSIVGASCSESGSLSVLQSTALCTTFTLSSSSASSRSLVATPLPTPLQFHGLVTSSSTSSSGLPSSPLAIHALKDSIIAVVGITTASPARLAILMWDTEYSVLLAERVATLPSPLPSPSDLNISTAGSSFTHLVITLSTYVLGASVTLPRTSNIASVLGAARSTANWLVPTNLIQDENRTSLVERIRKEVKAGRAAQADAAFFRWVEAEAESGSTEATLASATKAAAKIPFPSAFAAALVDAAFPPEDTNEGKEKDKEGPAFASGVVSALIWRGAAGQGMLGGPGGLYGALRRKRDWPIMLSALQHVPDIPEDEIIATIRDLLIPLHPPSTDPSSYTLAPLSNAPPIQNALAHVLAYPTSPAPLRLALRTHLRDAEDIVHVLKVLDGWLKRGLQFDVWELDGLQGEGWAGSKTGKNVGVSASTGKKKVKGAGMIPALEHILNFIQALLDTHLIILLQHRPAHPLLRSLSASLSPLPAHNDALQTLAAPLAPFAAEEALERKSGNQQHTPGSGSTWQAKEEWRKRRRAQLAAEAVAIGDYRFEELAL